MQKADDKLVFEKLKAGLELTSKQLLAQKALQDADIVVFRTGKIMRIKARDVQVQ